MTRGTHLLPAALVIGALSGCMSVLYIAREGPRQFFPPASVGLSPRDVNLGNAENPNLHGWHFPAYSRKGTAGSARKKSRGTLIHFHGNGENLTSHYRLMDWVIDEGWDYFIWDYPGYGLSAGEPSPANVRASAAAVLTWLQESDLPKPIVIYGHSLGGAIAQQAIHDTRGTIRICDVILDSTFASYRSVARRKMKTRWFLWPLQPVAWSLMSNGDGPGDPSDLAPLPVLVIAVTGDPVVEYENGEELFARLREPKEFWRVEHFSHNGSFIANEGELRGRLMARLARNCGSESPPPRRNFQEP